MPATPPPANPGAIDITIRQLTNPTPAQLSRLIEICRAAYDGDMYMSALTAARPANEIMFWTAAIQGALHAGEVFVALSPTPGVTPHHPSFPSSFSRSSSSTTAYSRDSLSTAAEDVDMDNEYAPPEEIRGVCVLFPPGGDFLTEGSAQTSLMNKYVASLPTETQQWWMHHLRPKYNDLLSAASLPLTGRRDTWYIRFLAVEPAWQRSGIGRKFVQDCALRRIDRESKEGLAGCAVVDVQTDGLVRMFQRHGFRVRGTKNLSSVQGGFPLFCMVRTPGGTTTNGHSHSALAANGAFSTTRASGSNSSSLAGSKPGSPRGGTSSGSSRSASPPSTESAPVKAGTKRYYDYTSEYGACSSPGKKRSSLYAVTESVPPVASLPVGVAGARY